MNLPIVPDFSLSCPHCLPNSGGFANLSRLSSLRVGPVPFPALERRRSERPVRSPTARAETLSPTDIGRESGTRAVSVNGNSKQDWYQYICCWNLLNVAAQI
jgi:hypothetical protein